MRVDANFFCTVPMPDAGDPSIAPTARRYGNADVIACYRNLVRWAKQADELGFDTMWLTEHHFQYEGYEVLPNLIQFGQHLAGITSGLRLGQMFNVVPQWHPLRLAEDFAIAWTMDPAKSEALEAITHRENASEPGFFEARAPSVPARSSNTAAAASARRAASGVTPSPPAPRRGPRPARRGPPLPRVSPAG